MRNKMAWFSFFCLIITAILIIPSIAGAYTIAYFAVQHRCYQDKSKGPNGNGQLNRVAFQIKDSEGAYVSSNLLTSIALYDPNGTQVDDVTLDSIVFSPVYTEIDGRYDGTSGYWSYDNPYSPSEFFATLNKGTNLIVGNYQLKIVFDGESLESTWAFTKQVILPYVDSNSIEYHFDKKDNLVVTWSISDKLLRTFPTAGTSARALIDVFKKSKKKTKFVGTLYVRVPTASGILFVPKAIVTSMQSVGKIFQITIQVRTNDNCNRSYSNTVEMN